MDPYVTLGLGLNRNADAKQIRSAYRKLAMKQHPDRGGDEEDFKRTASAYAILSDPEKRRLFDERGLDGIDELEAEAASRDAFESFFAGMHMDPREIFEDFMKQEQRQAPQSGAGVDVSGLAGMMSGLMGGSGGMGGVAGMAANMMGGSGGMGGMGGMAGMAANMMGGGSDSGPAPDREVQITLLEVVNGVRRRITMYRKTECEECLGVGKKPSQAGQNMGALGGLLGSFQPSCPTCLGTGRMDDPLTGWEADLIVRNGTRDGTVLRVGGQRVRIRYAPDPRFRVQGRDLHTTATVRWVDAMLGRDVAVPWVDDRILHFRPQGLKGSIPPGAFYKVATYGLPKEGSTISGDLYVKIRLSYPDRISRKVRQVLEIIFPPLETDVDRIEPGVPAEEPAQEGGCPVQ